MRLHQVLTGAANTSENSASVGYGCVEDYPFIVYSSGCDVVILDSKFQRVQIVTRQCATSNHVGLISCSETDGKIAVAYGKYIRIFGPRTTDASSQNKSLPFEWSLVSKITTSYTLNCLCWDRDGKRLLTGGDVLELWIESEKNLTQFVSWKSAWKCETPTPIYFIEFSSDGAYFASCGKNDCLVKVWFEIEKGDFLGVTNYADEAPYFDFLYIPHPRAVTGMSWRKTSSFMARNCVANVLLTSCVDNICRIWCETLEQKSKQDLPEEPNSSHCERHRFIPKSKYMTRDSSSYDSFQTNHHFHIAASIDPAKDIPVMSTVSYFTATDNHSSFVLHWVNNKEMFMTSIANLLLGSPSVTVEVESAASELSEGSAKMVDSPYINLIGDEAGDDDDKDEARAPVIPLSTLPPNEQIFLNDDPDLCNGNLLSQFSLLLRDWQTTPDSLLAINPADGSLLMFLVESLDSALGSDFRQTQISFSSCIPDVFPSADAHSLLHNLILYRMPGKLSMQTSNPGEVSGIYTHGRSKTSVYSQASRSLSLVSVETGAHPPVAMITTHKDGSMNQWQVDFADNTAFSTLISLSHLTRLSGHRFPLTGMFPHPSLPLLLSVSTFTAKNEEIAEYGERGTLCKNESVGSSECEKQQTLEGQPKGCQVAEQSVKENGLSSNGFSFSELILWQCDSVFPLSQTGGIMELAKLTSTTPDAFDKIAWLPKLFIHPLLTFNSSVTVSPKSVSPCACFIASDDTGLRFYQVVLDGRVLLDFLSGKQNYRRGMERANSFGSNDGEEYNASYPAVSTVNHLLQCIVSDQSGPKPGSVLKLCRLKTSRNVLRNPIFLHVFSEHIIAEGCSPGRTTCSRKDFYEDNFYLVALENTKLGDDRTQAGSQEGCTKTVIHMWRIEITTSNEEDDRLTGDVLFSPNEPAPASSITDFQENLKCGIRSRKVLTSHLELPDGVYVTIARASANTLSAVSENRVCSLPFLISTTCSDGVLRFWSCNVWDTLESFEWCYSWTEWKTGGSGEICDTPVGVDGIAVSMDCANTGRIAVVVRKDEGSEIKDQLPGSFSVIVWESESSGNAEWVLEDSFGIEGASSTQHACVRWFSCENGLFVLVVGISNMIHMYSLIKSDEQDVGHRYKKLATVETRSCATPSELGIFISFVRRGLLVVGIGYEVHVYSQWKDERPADTQVPSNTLRSPGLFNEVLRQNPTLPQYHPKYLMELLDFGKLRRVRAILNYLVRCVAGEEAVQAVVFNDEGNISRNRTRSVISTLSRTTSLSSTPVDILAKDSSHFSNIDCIPPIPIFDLLAADIDDSGSTRKDSVNLDTNTTNEPAQENDYSELFSTSFKNSFDSTEMHDHFPVIHTSRAPMSPVHFGLAQAGLLSEYLSKKQLPGLTRIEQLELQALADTLATTKNDLEESTSEIDRGLKFARKCDLAKDGVTGFMGGPSGGGGGYATTGSIGATEGSGGDAVDECGLRFLLAMRHNTCFLSSLPLVARTQLEHKGLSSSKFVWAFHSETQEELLAMLPGMIRGEPTWDELRQYGVGWWIKSNETLRRLIEKVAKTQFNSKQDPMDCSLFYMAMKKKTVLRGLFRTQGDTRMATFFSNNFSEERWRKAALKNAYSLLSKQRFEDAVAFFLLADSLWDAVRLCISHLKDVQLALVIARLYDTSADSLTYKRVLTEYVLYSDEGSCDANKDPFLRSIAYWISKKYHKALRTLLVEPGSSSDKKYNSLAASGSPDIFNFYVYLRTHPVLRRTQFEKVTKIDTPQLRRKTFQTQQSLSEVCMVPLPLTAFERRFYYMTAHNHYNAGCPDLSLQVLLELPPPENEGADNSSRNDGSFTTTETDAPDKNENMINTGILDMDWSKPVSSKLREEISSAFDWSQPVSSQRTNNTKKSTDFDWSKPVSEKVAGNSSSDFDWSKPVSNKLTGDSSSDFDWSQPVSSKLAENDEDSLDFNWSKPVSNKLAGDSSSNFDWSQPVSEKLNGQRSSDFAWSHPISSTELTNDKSNSEQEVVVDWSQPVSAVLGGTGLQDTSNETDCNGSISNGNASDERKTLSQEGSRELYVGENDVLNSDPNDVEPADVTECQGTEAISQRLKFQACLKLVADELCTLPHHCEIHNKDLRSTFTAWLKKELDLIHRICDFKPDGSNTNSLVPLKVSTSAVLETVSDDANLSSNSFSELVEDTANEKNNFAKKVEISAQHIEWLKENQTLLNILLNYCTLHGACGGDVATMKVELLILIHELEQQRHLMSPLYLTSAGSSIPPLILATMVSTFSLGASSFTYLSSMTQDILKYLTKLPGPPSPSQPLEMVSVLRSMSATLSACVFQSLVCGRDESESNESRGPTPNYDRPGSSHGMDSKRKPTSSPNKWPGVRLLRSLLITEAKDNASKLKVLLCEICVAIYLSLLAIAWCENDPNQLYYIICNNLTAEMWGVTFGGGRKVKEQRPLTPHEGKRRSASPTPQIPGNYWEAKRRKWNFKLLQGPPKVEKKIEEIENEEFLPPQLSLMEYFLRKPKEDPRKTFHFDSEVSSSSDSEASDDAFEEDIGRVIVKVKKKKVKPLDHFDPKSFTWKLMNYTISALVCHDINIFLADVGLEVSDLPTVSPLLHSAAKMLDHWKQVLFSKLKKSAPAPDGYINLYSVDHDEYPRGGPTLMKYKALIDPNNTPFRSTSAAANPAKRLWHTLVNKEQLQKTFLDFAFGQDSSKSEKPTGVVAEESDGSADDEEVKVLFKDSEAINSFCVSKTNSMRVVIATMRDVQELDVSPMMGISRTVYVDDNVGFDSDNRASDQEEFTMIYNGRDTSMPAFLGTGISAQSGVGSSVIMKRNVSGIKRMEEHPNLPYYLAGGHDGSLRIWEFGHEREIASYRESGKYQRVTKVHFSQHGCKFGVMDFGGQLVLYQSVNTAKTSAITTLKCHNKQGNDFSFLGSTSFLATSGYSSDGCNVCLWDTLLPPSSSLVHAFNCHDSGSSCQVYVPGKRLLLSGGRKGDIYIFDLRQRQIMHTFTAYVSDVKSIAVDESEEFFATGSLDGDIKIWNLSAHDELLSFPGIHGRSNYQLIKMGTQGVPRICLQPGGQMVSCGGDGTLKWRQLPIKNLIVNSPF